jgi:hypothetical protein
MIGLARLLDDLAFSLHVGGEVHHAVVSGAMDIARHVMRYLLPMVRRGRMSWLVGALAVPLLLLGFSSGDEVLLLTGVLLAMGAVLAWTAQASR